MEQLHSVPIDPVNNPANLAQRNLLRGLRMGLPSGQDVARSMGIEPIRDRDLRVGKAVVEDWDSNPTLASIHDSFIGRAPLWYYVLAEAQHEWIQRATGRRRQGRRRAAQARHDRRAHRRRKRCSVCSGEMGHSYLRQAPNWTPATDSQHEGT